MVIFKRPKTHAGVGINYRNEIAGDILKNIDKIDFIEVNTERFFVNIHNLALQNIMNILPVVLHGLTLSIGTNHQTIPEDFIQKTSEAIEKTNCLWFSEHIAVTNVDNFEIRALSPIEFTNDSIINIIRKVDELKSITNKPFLLENIAYYYNMPSNTMDESQFFKTILAKADCGLLLDLNNLYVNSINHQYDPYKFIDNLPLERLVEVHLAGCEYMHGMLIDTHASAIRSEVYDLFDYLCSKTFINGVVIERDDKLINFSDLLDEIRLVKSILHKHGDYIPTRESICTI